MGASSSCCNISSFGVMPSPMTVQDYDFGEVIGKGGSGVVRMARHKSSKEVFVMKEVDFTSTTFEPNLKSFQSEVAVLKKLSGHHGIAQIHLAFHTANTCYMGLSYERGGDLRFHINNNTPFTEVEVAYLMSSVGSALHFIHDRGIIHRDVKPENIVLNDRGHPILVDFGVAFTKPDSAVAPLCSSTSGTSIYLAPEVLTKSHRHSYHVDFWGLGVTAFELLFLQVPFKRHCPRALIDFSENHYSVMWDILAGMEIPDDDLSVSQVSNYHPDWEDLAQCSEERLFLSNQPLSDTPLNDVNSPSPQLLVLIPGKTVLGDIVSPSCVRFLQGLMDVRIPCRLGVGKTYKAFKNHEWFTQFNAFKLLKCDDNGIALAPFVPEVRKVEDRCKRLHLEATFARSTRDVLNMKPPRLSDAEQTKLDQINYMSPHFYDAVITGKSSRRTLVPTSQNYRMDSWTIGTGNTQVHLCD
jgi:serine/threonine protein kinase